MKKALLDIYKKLKDIKAVCALRNEPLANHTTFKIGGPADILVIPKSVDGLKEFIKIAGRLPIKIIGNGSNILVSDKGIRGIVLKLARGLNGVEVDKNRIKAGSGVMVPKLLNLAANAGLSGMEFSAGIPGTIGGAVVTNMGAFGRSISNIVKEIIVIDRDGKEHSIKNEQIKFKYRRGCVLKNGEVVVGVVLSMRRARKSFVKKRIREFLNMKRITQPLSVPSAGCVFRNPKGKYAGKLIEDADCKGLRMGGAEVSRTHANYIINLGDATCNDVRALAKKIRGKVKEKFGVTLKCEIIDSNHLNMLS